MSEQHNKANGSSGKSARFNQQTAGLTSNPKQALSSESVEGLLTRRELARRWACCEHTVARVKSLKPLRFNKRMLRYRIADVEAIEAAAIG